MTTRVQEFSDDFERADSATLGSNWEEMGSGAFRITSGAAMPDGTSTQAARVVQAMTLADHYIEATQGNTYGGSYEGLMVRGPSSLGADMASNGAMYVVMLSGSTGTAFSIRRKAANNNVFTILASGNSTTDGRVEGSVWRAETLGNDILFFLNDALVVKATDTEGIVPSTQKYVGLYAAGSGNGGATNHRIGSVRAGRSIADADTRAPTVPTGLSVDATDATSVDLSWNPSTDNVGVASYRVRRNGVDVSGAAALTSTFFSDTGRTPGTTYTYTVSAVDAAGNRSAESASVSATTANLDTTAPTVPTGLTASASSPTLVHLAWAAATDSTGVASYRLRRNGVDVAGATALTGLTFDDSSVAAATSYSYTVSAVDFAGNRSAESAAVSVTTLSLASTSGTVLDKWDGTQLVRQRLDAWTGTALVQHILGDPVNPTPPSDTTAPSTPSGLVATAVSSSQINLDWNPSTDNVGVDHYIVRRSGVVVSTSVTDSAYIDTGRTSNTTYSYTVQAVDAAGNLSAQSSTASATTLTAGGGGGTGGDLTAIRFIRDDQIPSLSTSSAAALRAKATADAVKNGTYVGGSGVAGDVKDVNTRAGAVALTTYIWWKRTGDNSYLAPLKQFILACPKPPSSVQALNEFRGLHGIFAAVRGLMDAGQWSNSAQCPNHNNDTWLTFVTNYHTRTVGGANLAQSLRGLNPGVDKTANNWNAVAMATHLQWALVVNNTSEIDHNMKRLKKYLGDQTTGLSNYQTTSNYLSSWDNWGAPTLQAGIGKYDPSNPGLDGVVIDDICRGDTGYSPGSAFYGATAKGLTYPLEAADYIWAQAAAYINGGYPVRTWGEHGDAFDRMNARFDRHRTSSEDSMFDHSEAAYDLYNNGRFVASHLSQADYSMSDAKPTTSGTGGLSRSMPLGDWLAPADGSSTWGRP